MPIVREQDLIKYLTVPADSLSPAEYEIAIQAMVERQQFGNGMAVNFASTVFKKGERPNRQWTNLRTDFDPVVEAVPVVDLAATQAKKIADLEAEIAEMKKPSGEIEGTIHINKKPDGRTKEFKQANAA